MIFCRSLGENGISTKSRTKNFPATPARRQISRNGRMMCRSAISGGSRQVPPDRLVGVHFARYTSRMAARVGQVHDLVHLDLTGEDNEVLQVVEGRIARNCGDYRQKSGWQRTLDQDRDRRPFFQISTIPR
jgi:hypothetical protein